MATHIALLRGINLGGHKRVAMADLRALLSKLGFDEPRSVLQSGNLVFRSAARARTALERQLEEQTREQLGLCTDFFVRSASEWKKLMAANPFREQAERDPGRLLVVFLKRAPKDADVRSLATVPGPEVVRARGREVYVVYPKGIGRSRLTHAVIEKRLGVRGTGRSWNTVSKLAALADGRT